VTGKRFLSLYLLLLNVLITGLFAAGCHSEPEKHYPVQGEVISAEPQRGTITLKHGEIPGLMPAMTMSYIVDDPKQLEALKPGDKISADLVISDSKGRLEKVVLLNKADQTLRQRNRLAH
jgi:Cu/Ag efflux protein CusF